MSKKQTAMQFTRSFTGRATLVYLTIIMFMSLTCSVVFYATAAHQLHRQLPPPAMYDDHGKNTGYGQQTDFDDFFAERIDEGRNELLERLVLINILTLLVGGLVSYGLARVTQRPVEAVIATQRRLLKASGAFPELEEIDNTLAMTLTLQPVSLHATTKRAVQATPLIAKKKVHLDNTIPEDCKVLADDATLTRLIALILQNAAQHSAEETTMHLSATSRANRVVLTIRDEGEGIAASDLPHITEEFYQADRNHKSAERTGHGLGLALAQVLAQKNEGSLRIRSIPEQGTTVEITLKALR